MSDLPTYVLERTFDAPREMVWRTWTDPKLLARWYGPGVESIIHKLDVKPGGVWLNEMKMAHGSFYERFEFLEVDEPARLVWLQSNSNAEWSGNAPPMMENWPQTLKAVVTLTDDGDRTKLHFAWTPNEASETEQQVFAAAMEGMGKGWESGMDIVAEILAELQS
ncbi:MAG: SRPBCC domain-containing protein [Rhodobacteraceae bacterium]|nr:SRPBCC domain-containing protein [Paracoccaceae bacterium]